MSVPTLIEMFMQNTCCAVNNWFKELKQQELTWKQSLIEVNVINDEEARWNSSKCKEDDKGRQLPSFCINDKNVSKLARKSQEVLFPAVLKSFGRN